MTRATACVLLCAMALLAGCRLDAEVDVQFFPGGSLPARFWGMTWLQVRDRVGLVCHRNRAGRRGISS